MNINVKSSSLAANPTGGAGVIPFDELNREAVANVLVRDGETIVLGGILKDTASSSEAGIPYLKDIPVLGWLFKSNRMQKDFEELMVFITPRITDAGATNLPSAEQLWRDQMKTTYGDKEGPAGIKSVVLTKIALGVRELCRTLRIRCFSSSRTSYPLDHRPYA